MERLDRLVFIYSQLQKVNERFDQGGRITRSQKEKALDYYNEFIESQAMVTDNQEHPFFQENIPAKFQAVWKTLSGKLATANLERTPLELAFLKQERAMRLLNATLQQLAGVDDKTSIQHLLDQVSRQLEEVHSLDGKIMELDKDLNTEYFTQDHYSQIVSRTNELVTKKLKASNSGKSSDNIQIREEAVRLPPLSLDNSAMIVGEQLPIIKMTSKQFRHQ